MSLRVTTITRKALIIKGKEAGIINPDQLFTRKLLNRVNKYDKKRVSRNIYRRFIEFAQKTSIKDKIHQKATYAKQER